MTKNIEGLSILKEQGRQVSRKVMVTSLTGQLKWKQIKNVPPLDINI